MIDKYEHQFFIQPPEEIVAYLRHAHELGFLGTPEPSAHLAVAARFNRALPHTVHRCLDLGSGAGVPGLLLALARPDTTWVLLDSHTRRMAFVERYCEQFGVQQRVTAVCTRAEIAARDCAFRGQFDAVTARGFGVPAVTAECAAGFLKDEGLLLVSDPEETPLRWVNESLAQLGMRYEQSAEPYLASLRQSFSCPDRFPRRQGIPKKRPLFT